MKRIASLFIAILLMTVVGLATAENDYLITLTLTPGSKVTDEPVYCVLDGSNGDFLEVILMCKSINAVSAESFTQFGNLPNNDVVASVICDSTMLFVYNIDGDYVAYIVGDPFVFDGKVIPSINQGTYAFSVSTLANGLTHVDIVKM